MHACRKILRSDCIHSREREGENRKEFIGPSLFFCPFDLHILLLKTPLISLWHFTAAQYNCEVTWALVMTTICTLTLLVCAPLISLWHFTATQYNCEVTWALVMTTICTLTLLVCAPLISLWHFTATQYNCEVTWTLVMTNHLHTDFTCVCFIYRPDLSNKLSPVTGH